jgi:hypothetical protein
MISVPKGNSAGLRRAALIMTALLCGALSARAAEPERSLQARLSSDRLGHLEPGTYLAGEKTEFELSAAGSNYLLRCDRSPEVFVVTPDNAPMGGRVFRYDSGETALQVAGWGGVTLYTDANPEGLPAVRTADAAAFSPAPASEKDVRTAAQDLAETLERLHRIDVVFVVDWPGLPDTSLARGRILDALENIARAFDRLGHSVRWRQALSRRISQIVLAKAGTPAVKLSGKTLFITFNPDAGYEGRASSRAIASALGTLLSVAQKQS